MTNFQTKLLLKLAEINDVLLHNKIVTETTAPVQHFIEHRNELEQLVDEVTTELVHETSPAPATPVTPPAPLGPDAAAIAKLAQEGAEIAEQILEAAQHAPAIPVSNVIPINTGIVQPSVSEHTT